MYSQELLDWIQEVESGENDRSVELKKKKHKPYKDQLIRETQWIDAKQSKSTRIRFGMRIDCLKNNITEYPPCRICGDPVKSIRKEKFNETCGTKACKDAALDKAARSYQEEHGHPMHNEEISKRARENQKKFYESDYYLEHREEYFSTLRTGITPKERTDHKGNVFYGEEEWYGVHPDTITQDGKLTITSIRNGHNKRRELKWRQFLDKHTLEGKIIGPKKDQYDERQKEILLNVDEISKFYDENRTLTQTAKRIGIAPRRVKASLEYFDIPIRQHNKVSSYEYRVCDFLESLGFNNLQRNTKDVMGEEIDIIVPELNLAIELNGIYWHTRKFITDEYKHQNKSLEILDAGYSFLAIWEDDIYKSTAWMSDLVDFIRIVKREEDQEGRLSLERITHREYLKRTKVLPPESYYVYRSTTFDRQLLDEVNEYDEYPDDRLIDGFGFIE